MYLDFCVSLFFCSLSLASSPGKILIYYFSTEHSPRACSRHRRSQSFVFGGRKTADCRGKTSQNHRDQQVEDPKELGLDENQVQNFTIQVGLFPKFLLLHLINVSIISSTKVVGMLHNFYVIFVDLGRRAERQF